MDILDLIKEKILSQTPVLLLLDYDGTLTPIVETPPKALLEAEVKEALETIVKNPWLKLALVSGRTIQSLQAVSGLSNQAILFSGLHGGEILVAGCYRNSAIEAQKATIRTLSQALKKALQPIQGIVFEEKDGCAIAIHYRNVPSLEAVEVIEETVATLLEAYNNNNQVRVQMGKKVMELLPVSFNKGNSVNALIGEFPSYFPIYCGDDITDIAAFQAVQKHQGLAVGVVANNENASVLAQYVNKVVTFEALKAVILAIAALPFDRERHE